MIDELACATKAKQAMVYGMVDFGVVKCREQSSIVKGWDCVAEEK